MVKGLAPVERLTIKNNQPVPNESETIIIHSNRFLKSRLNLDIIPGVTVRIKFNLRIKDYD